MEQHQEPTPAELQRRAQETSALHEQNMQAEQQRAKKYDSTVARITGNIASGLCNDSTVWPIGDNAQKIAAAAVKLALAIVAEVKAQESK